MLILVGYAFESYVTVVRVDVLHSYNILYVSYDLLYFL
jgi:hypothetical protein